MSSNPLHSADPGVNPQGHSAHCHESPLVDRFCKQQGGWFVRNGDSEYIGPFADKADAQMALLYYAARLFWPSQKQLREFARSGK